MGNKLTEYDVIINVLQDIYSGNVTIYWDWGICDNVNEIMLYLPYPKSYTHTFHSQFYRMIKEWTYYSGCTSYPIPSPFPGISEKVIFYSKDHPNWDKETRYGRLRYDLLKYLISEFQKLSNENSTTE